MAFGDCYNPDTHISCKIIMLTRFADFFQQGNRWLNWYQKQPEGSVRAVVVEAVTKIMAWGIEFSHSLCP